MIYVVGSGPSGVSVTKALLALGQEVRMLDYGLTLEEDRLKVLNELKELPRENWDPGKIDFLKGPVKVSNRGVDFKNAYGSDFPYRGEHFVELPPRGIEVKPSLAAGGLSNVWGAAILPARKTDLADWPIPSEALIPHYQAVLSLLDVSASEDELANPFPLYTDKPQYLKLSNQGHKLLETLGLNRDELSKAGIGFGQARLALRAEDSPEGPGCVYCGLCLTGCPYELIYNSWHTVKKFKANPKFQYRPDVNVKTVEETPEGVVIKGSDGKTGEDVTFNGDRVYLAAGPFSTAQILLQSQSAFEKEIYFKTSQYFMVPFISNFAIKDVRRESLYTLAQIFVEIMDEAISHQTVHLQFYSYNEMYLSYFKSKIGFLAGLADPLIDRVLGRLFIVQSFLHSNDSSLIAVKLKRQLGNSILTLSPAVKPRAREVVKKVLGKIKRHSGLMGGFPLTPFLHFGALGDGNHTGGSFPMKRSPSQFETDIAGRPFGFKRVHLVDSSVLPTIPGTTITLTIMANAHRIGSMEKDL